MILGSLIALDGSVFAALQVANIGKSGPKRSITHGDRIFDLGLEWWADHKLVYHEREVLDREHIPGTGLDIVTLAGAQPKPPAELVTLTLVRKEGSTSTMTARADEMPLYVERVELKNGFGNWALGYAALAPDKAGAKVRYMRVGQTLEYREG